MRSVSALSSDSASAPDDEAGFRHALGDHIGRAFGERVLAIVRHVTEEKRERNGERRPWKTRKLEQLVAMRRAGPEVAALKAADLLHNVQALARDVRAEGRSVMERFNAPPADVRWYYQETASLIVGRLGEENPLARELKSVVELFEEALAGLPGD